MFDEDRNRETLARKVPTFYSQGSAASERRVGLKPYASLWDLLRCGGIGTSRDGWKLLAQDCISVSAIMCLSSAHSETYTPQYGAAPLVCPGDALGAVSRVVEAFPLPK